MEALDRIIDAMQADAIENAAHSQGVGSPTACRCAACRVVALRSLAEALAVPDAALAAFRLADAERVIGESMPIGEAQALVLMVIEIETERAHGRMESIALHADGRSPAGTLAAALHAERGAGWYSLRPVEGGWALAGGPFGTLEGAQSCAA
jgi:hypothetical protein